VCNKKLVYGKRMEDVDGVQGVGKTGGKESEGRRKRTV